MPPSKLPTRYKMAAQFRREVLARENQTAKFLVSRYQFSLQKLNRDIFNLTTKIEQAQRANQKLGRDWLRRLGEYHRLQTSIIEEVNRYSVDAADEITRQIAWAAPKGAADALALTESAFHVAVQSQVSFRKLPVDTILNISGRIAPGTPTGKLLEKMGEETAQAARNVLVDGIARGINVKEIARDLHTVAGLPVKRATDTAYTEIFGAYRDSHHETFKQNKSVLECWVWMAHTGSCCGGCLARHGTKHDIDEFMPAHVRCHCEPVPEPKSFADIGFANGKELDAMFSDPYNPKAMRAQAEAVLDQSEKDLAKRFGPGKARLIKSGEVKLNDLATTIKSQKWGNSVVETPLKNLRGGSGPIPRRKPTVPKPPTPKTPIAPKSNISTVFENSGPARKKFEEAIRIVESVHKPSLNLRFQGAKGLGKRTNGQHEGLFDGSAIRLRDRDGATLTAIHEIGHAIDFQSFRKYLGTNWMGTGGVRAYPDHPLKGWKAAVRKSEVVRRIDQNLEYSYKHKQYLKQDTEVWARSYEQYIATKVKNEKMLDAIYSSDRYFTKEEFAAIEKEMDIAFARIFEQ